MVFVEEEVEKGDGVGFEVVFGGGVGGEVEVMVGEGEEVVIERKGVVDLGVVGLEEVVGVVVEGYDYFDVGVVEEEVVL